MKNVKREDLERLKQEAVKALLKRSRINLHSGESDPIQEMIIAVHKDSYLRPHRQRNKRKSYNILEGEMFVAFFDDNGNLTDKVRMSQTGIQGDIYLRFDAGIWHTILPLSEIVVFTEVIPGPYLPDNTEYADWAPGQEDTGDLRIFHQKLMRLLRINNELSSGLLPI